jgi:DNA-binding XRE family transcriptional regulator
MIKKNQVLEKIFESQEARKMSSREVARKAGLSATSYHLIRKGTQNPSWETLFSLADAVGLKVSITFRK